MLGVRVSEKMQEMIVKENEAFVLLSVSRICNLQYAKHKPVCLAFPASLLCFRFLHGILHNKGVYILAEITGFSRNSSPTFIYKSQMRKVPCLVKTSTRT